MPGVEHDAVEPRAPRDPRGRNAAHERERVPVEAPDLDALVDQVVVVRPGVAVGQDALGVGLRGGGAGEREGEQQREPQHTRKEFTTEGTASTGGWRARG
jgi:hypothetical protein